MYSASLVVRNSKGERVANMTLFTSNSFERVEKFIEDSERMPDAQEAFVFMRHFYGPDAIISMQKEAK